MRGDGFLAIWSDVEAAQETDYLHWLTREHTAERMGVDGFLAVRVFRALLPQVNRFLIVYELEAPEALSGPSYLARLNAPTPWSQRIMPILGNFRRGGGRRLTSQGSGRGGCVAALTDGARQDAEILTALAAQDRIAAVHLLRTDQEKTAIRTHEKALRPQDESFAALLLVEGLESAALHRALAACPAALPAGRSVDDVTLYSQIFALETERR